MTDLSQKPPTPGLPTKKRRLEPRLARALAVMCLLAALSVSSWLTTRSSGLPGARRGSHCQFAWSPGRPIAWNAPEELGFPDVIPTHHHPLLGGRRLTIRWPIRRGGRGAWASCSTVGRSCWSFTTATIAFLAFGNSLTSTRTCFYSVRLAQVVAISADPAKLTRRRYDEYGRFSFPVLSDPGNEVARAYGLVRPGTGDPRGALRHGIFIVDPAGTVRWVNFGDMPFRCNSALLHELSKINEVSTTSHDGP